jgi:PIN domain nuclease of toxin-antitoxin system
VRILLDTQSWIWLASSPERFSSSVRALLETEDNELYLSAASPWEIAIKYSNGKLRLPDPPAAYVPSRIEMTRVRPLSIDYTHALHVALLPRHHRDPFDRLIIAQAQIEDLTIVTSDPQFAAYDVQIISAS